MSEFFKAPVFQTSREKSLPYRQDPTFLSAVSAAWQLEPLGQIAMDQGTYLDKP